MKTNKKVNIFRILFLGLSHPEIKNLDQLIIIQELQNYEESNKTYKQGSKRINKENFDKISTHQVVSDDQRTIFTLDEEKIPQHVELLKTEIKKLLQKKAEKLQEELDYINSLSSVE